MRGNYPCWSAAGSGDGGGARIDADALVGELLVNRYRIEETVAQGPVATVFRARDGETDRDVAVKLLEPVIDPEGETARGMVSDVEKAADIQHPSIVPVSEIGLHQGETIFVVEPFVAAETVADRLAEDGPFKPRVAMRIAREVFEGLTALHSRGLIHLNVKPENIFLVRDAMGAERAVLSGTALHHVMGLKEASQRDPSGCHARPEYISPEAVAGRSMDILSDVYLTGLVLYEMLCGRPAFSGTDFRKTARRHAIERPLSPRIVRRQAQISKTLDAFVMRCLEKTSSRRYGSAEEASLALQEMANTDDSSRNRTSLNFRPVSTDMPTSVASEASLESISVNPETEATAQELLETSQSLPAVDEIPNPATSGSAGAAAGAPEDSTPESEPDPSADTEDAVEAVGEPKLIVTDPKMRAMTQPLVSTATRSPAKAEETSRPEAESQTIRLSSSHDGEPGPGPAQFRETGQWFVESVEDLEAQNPHLVELDDLDLPKDRNLLPWVMGILLLVVVTVFAFLDEPAEPAWKTRLKTAKKNVTKKIIVPTKTIAKASTTESTTQDGSLGTPDAAGSQDKPAKLAALEKVARAAIAASSWQGEPTAFLETLAQMQALEPTHAGIKVVSGEATTSLLSMANDALKAEDFVKATTQTKLALKIVPESVVAKTLQKAIDAAQAKSARADEAAAQAALAQAANAKAAKAKAAAADAQRAAAAKATAAAKASAAVKAAASAKAAAAAKKNAAAAAAKRNAAAAAAKKTAAAAAAKRNAAAAAKRAAAAAAKRAAAAAAKKAATQAAAARRAAAAKRVPPAKKVATGPSAKDLVREGNTHIKNARWSAASTAFKGALRKNKRLASAHSGLGKVAFQKGKFKEAVNHHSRSVRHSSKTPSYRVDLALAYFKTKNYPRAKKECEAALKLQPSNSKAKRYLKVIDKKLKK